MTTVAADNCAPLAMLRRLGETTVTPAGISCLDVVVDLMVPLPTDTHDIETCDA